MPWNKSKIDSMGITQLVAGIKLLGEYLLSYGDGDVYCCVWGVWSRIL